MKNPVLPPCKGEMANSSRCSQALLVRRRNSSKLQVPSLFSNQSSRTSLLRQEGADVQKSEGDAYLLVVNRAS
jgi:hypothetical protein